mgnify:CR=1 FL=1|jgi:hypothetical protein|tara:strand:+ start:56 stop:178 length:123 start_codon:yes stop_codon:yes gene_type:complete
MYKNLGVVQVPKIKMHLTRIAKRRGWKGQFEEKGLGYFKD